MSSHNTMNKNTMSGNTSYANITRSASSSRRSPADVTEFGNSPFINNCNWPAPYVKHNEAPTTQNKSISTNNYSSQQEVPITTSANLMVAAVQTIEAPGIPTTLKYHSGVDFISDTEKPVDMNVYDPTASYAPLEGFHVHDSRNYDAYVPKSYVAARRPRQGESFAIDFIPDDKCGLVIGDHGKEVNTIQKLTGCRLVSLGKQNENINNHRPVYFTGKAEAIKWARKEVWDLIKRSGPLQPETAKVQKQEIKAQPCKFAGASQIDDALLMVENLPRLAQNQSPGCVDKIVTTLRNTSDTLTGENLVDGVNVLQQDKDEIVRLKRSNHELKVDLLAQNTDVQINQLRWKHAQDLKEIERSIDAEVIRRVENLMVINEKAHSQIRDLLVNNQDLEFKVISMEIENERLSLEKLDLTDDLSETNKARVRLHNRLTNLLLLQQHPIIEVEVEEL